jgi:hypothetical protein
LVEVGTTDRPGFFERIRTAIEVFGAGTSVVALGLGNDAGVNSSSRNEIKLGCSASELTVGKQSCKS